MVSALLQAWCQVKHGRKVKIRGHHHHGQKRAFIGEPQNSAMGSVLAVKPLALEQQRQNQYPWCRSPFLGSSLPEQHPECLS